jgi:hypothetical protein
MLTESVAAIRAQGVFHALYVHPWRTRRALWICLVGGTSSNVRQLPMLLSAAFPRRPRPKSPRMNRLLRHWNCPHFYHRLHHRCDRRGHHWRAILHHS